MFAKIEDFVCKCIKTEKQYELVSTQENATKYGFEKDGKIYYKKINSLFDIDEVYDVYFWVEYETHLEQVNTMWEIKIAKDSINGDCVKLLFSEGYLPNWTVEEKGVCSRYVSIENIGRIIVEYRFHKKSEINNSGIVKKCISKNEFIRLLNQYLNV